MKNQNLKLKAIRVLAVILVSIFSYINLSAQHYINEYDTRCGAVSGTDYGRSIINRVDSGYAGIKGFCVLICIKINVIFVAVFRVKFASTIK